MLEQQLSIYKPGSEVRMHKGGPKKGTPVDVRPRDSEREKAFELFLNASKGGKIRSIRAIAQTVGVHEATITRWRKIDGWDDKIHHIITQAAQAADILTNAIKRRVRQGILSGLDELLKMVKKSEKDVDRIAAVRALVDIGLRLDAIAQAGTETGAASGSFPAFKDDLDVPGEQPECLDTLPPPDLDSMEKSTIQDPSTIPPVPEDLI